MFTTYGTGVETVLRFFSWQESGEVLLIKDQENLPLNQRHAEV